MELKFAENKELGSPYDNVLVFVFIVERDAPSHYIYKELVNLHIVVGLWYDNAKLLVAVRKRTGVTLEEKDTKGPEEPEQKVAFPFFIANALSSDVKSRYFDKVSYSPFIKQPTSKSWRYECVQMHVKVRVFNDLQYYPFHIVVLPINIEALDYNSYLNFVSAGSTWGLGSPYDISNEVKNIRFKWRHTERAVWKSYRKKRDLELKQKRNAKDASNETDETAPLLKQDVSWSPW